MSPISHLFQFLRDFWVSPISSFISFLGVPYFLLFLEAVGTAISAQRFLGVPYFFRISFLSISFGCPLFLLYFFSKLPPTYGAVGFTGA